MDLFNYSLEFQDEIMGIWQTPNLMMNVFITDTEINDTDTKTLNKSEV